MALVLLLDFWSAVKLSFLAAVALAVVTVVSFFLVFMVIQTTGLIARFDDFFQSISDGGITISAFVGLPQVMAFAAIIAILNLIVVTVLRLVVGGGLALVATWLIGTLLGTTGIV